MLIVVLIFVADQNCNYFAEAQILLGGSCICIATKKIVSENCSFLGYYVVSGGNLYNKNQQNALYTLTLFQ
jgi:hypothetical protein